MTGIAEQNRLRLREVAGLFLKLGTLSFGGPAAHTALMEDEVVRRRQWMTREEFLDLVGMTNLIPGPNSTELAIIIGRRRAGWPGLLVAGAGFILPAVFIVTFFAWMYVRFGALPQVHALLLGVKPVILAVVIQALWRLGNTAIKNCALGLLAAAAAALGFLGVHELVILFGIGLLAVSYFSLKQRWKAGQTLMWSGLAALPMAGAGLPATALAVAAPFTLGAMFLFFLKVGAVLYGSGYVLLAFLQADLVERWHWLTESQLLDAVAVGQFTPGPLFTTATFIGYVLGGLPGATLATLGIFLPAFLFVAISEPFLPRLRKNPSAGAFLDGLNVASLALMLVVTVQLTASTVVDWPSLVLALLAGWLLLRYKVNSVWLVLSGALAGELRWLMGF
ncbi:MAG: chromate efflux transporter [Verrucomicrobiota bacterium]